MNISEFERTKPSEIVSKLSSLIKDIRAEKLNTENSHNLELFEHVIEELRKIRHDIKNYSL